MELPGYVMLLSVPHIYIRVYVCGYVCMMYACVLLPLCCTSFEAGSLSEPKTIMFFGGEGAMAATIKLRGFPVSSLQYWGAGVCNITPASFKLQSSGFRAMVTMREQLW